MIAITIGAVAQSVLKISNPVAPMGLTSRGLFLCLANRWVIFLSTEQFPGPLTINVAGKPHELEQLERDSAVIVREGAIIFPNSDLTLLTHSARVWLPPPRPYRYLPSNQTRALLIQTSRLLYRRKKAGGFAALLPALWRENVELDGPYINILSLARNLLDTLQTGQILPIVERIEPLLGLGAGLTPSGDDLVVGLLLALNRWGDILARGLVLDELNRATLELAYSKTTLLSANLIECATLGQADQRLITALDGLVTGAPAAAGIAASLAGWGNSSGVDALCGMIIALLCA